MPSAFLGPSPSVVMRSRRSAAEWCRSVKRIDEWNQEAIRKTNGAGEANDTAVRAPGRCYLPVTRCS
jgi:hypothetical protein